MTTIVRMQFQDVYQLIFNFKIDCEYSFVGFQDRLRFLYSHIQILTFIFIFIIYIRLQRTSPRVPYGPPHIPPFNCLFVITIFI